MAETDDDIQADINKAFGAYLVGLMSGNNIHQSKLSFKALASILKNEKGEQICSAQYLNQVTRGEVKPSIPLLEALANYYKEDVDRLRCLAGRPSAAVLKALAQAPEKYLGMMMTTPTQTKIAVTSVAWAAHILMTEDIYEPNLYPTQFKCVPRITGRSATEMLLNDQVEFAAITERVMRWAELDNNAVLQVVMDFTMSTLDDIYYLYKLEDVAENELPYGALSDTIAAELAVDYANNNQLKAPVLRKYFDHEVEKSLVRELLEGNIAGFHGWPFLNLHAEQLLREKSSQYGKNSRQWVFEVKKVHRQPVRVPLCLVTKKSFIIRDSTKQILHDLIGKLIIARERINNDANKTKVIYELFERKLRTKISKTPYVTQEAVTALLKNNVCDVNIASTTYQKIMSGIG